MTLPAASALDPLTRSLLPVVMHRLGNASQLLSGLNALLGLGAEAEELVAERVGDLADAAQEVEQLGWVLGVLATAAGADLLLDRRRADGLALVVELVRHVRRREGFDLAACETAVPELATRVEAGGPGRGGWEVAWSVGNVLLAAAEGGGSLRYGFEHARDDAVRLRIGGELPADFDAELAARIRALDCGEWRATDSGWELLLPAGACRLAR